MFASVIFDASGTLAKAGMFLKAHGGSSFAIFIIFLSSGMIIEMDQIQAGIRDIRATLAALVCIALVAPLAALVLTRLPLDPGVVIGLILVSVVPTTLSSGVVMTGQAGGNMAHALFVTILSNCVAIFTIPLVLPALVSGIEFSHAIAIDQWGIFIKLVLLVLVPLVAGLLLKRYLLNIGAPVKKKLGMFNQSMVLGIVFMSLSGAREVLISQASILLWILPLVVAFHLILLGAAFGGTRILGMGRGRRESVIFMGAQKTLPLAVMLQLTCFPEFGTALLVCVLHHVSHLMMDGYIAAQMGDESA
ncbi:MAG: bile acid:sodium symporter [Desulfobacterales bacterium]|nr:bile acid:sodium symporter [Desulfobacterales bacterium]